MKNKKLIYIISENMLRYCSRDIGDDYSPVSVFGKYLKDIDNTLYNT